MLPAESFTVAGAPTAEAMAAPRSKLGWTTFSGLPPRKKDDEDEQDDDAADMSSCLSLFEVPGQSVRVLPAEVPAAAVIPPPADEARSGFQRSASSESPRSSVSPLAFALWGKTTRCVSSRKKRRGEQEGGRQHRVS